LAFRWPSPAGISKLPPKWRNWSDRSSVILFSKIFSIQISFLRNQLLQVLPGLRKCVHGKRQGVLSGKKLLTDHIDQLLFASVKGLKQCARLKALARVHAENGSVIAEKQKELLNGGVTGPEGEQPSISPSFGLSLSLISPKATHSQGPRRFCPGPYGQ
jgi:hypothetical protein